MQTVAVWAAFVLTQSSRFFVAGARPRYADSPMSSQPAVISGLTDKREGIIEPSCEELRAMWRYTKRQSRKVDMASDFPIYPDPMPYSLWDMYPERPRPAYTYRANYPGRQRNRGAPIYGRLVMNAPASSRFRNGMPHRPRAFEDIPQFYGTVNHHPPSPRRRITNFRIGGGGSPPMYHQVPQSGQFQHLQELIRTERAHELQEQHAADQLAARAAGMEVLTGDNFENTRHSEKQYLNSLRAYQVPIKANHDFGQSHCMSSVGDASRAWTRGGHYSREYLSR